MTLTADGPNSGGQVRIKPGKTWLTTIAPLTSDDSLWWPFADVLHSYFETGAIPQIDACLRLEGHGRLTDLKPIELPGLGVFDPSQPDADLFLHLAEGRLRLQAGHSDLDPAERDRLATVYKLWDNSACSGIYLEVHPEEPRKHARKGIVLGPDGPYETKAKSFEEPGKWFFPPFYSLVTAAGRLLLYLAMREAGGTIAYWDTDSLAMVSTRNGGLIPCAGGKERDAQGRECVRALSHAQVEAIRWRLERHSPYSESVRPEALLTVEGEAGGLRPVPIPQPTLFRLEDENFVGTLNGSPRDVYMYAVASKRKTAHALDEDGRAFAVSPSEFALGHLHDPTGSNSKTWIADGWQWAALDGPGPDWLDQPALSHVQLTRYADLARLGGRKRDAPRPWDTLVVASADRTHGRNTEANLPRPVTRYQPGLDLAGADWIDFDTGTPLPRVQLPDEQAFASVSRTRPTYLRTLRAVLAAHVRAPERKSAQYGQPWGARTHGLLQPATTHAHTAIPIGRETNYTDQAGVLNDPDYTSYPDTSRSEADERALAINRAISRQPQGRAKLAEAIGVCDRTFRRYLQAGRIRPNTLKRAREFAAAAARELLSRRSGTGLPGDTEALLYLGARYLDVDAAPECKGCGRELSGRQRRWCTRCRNTPRVRARVRTR